MKLKLLKLLSMPLVTAVAACGAMAQAESITGNVVVDVSGELSDNLYIGCDADGSLEIKGGVKYDTSAGSDKSTTRTLQIGSSSSTGSLIVKEKSTFIGPGTNFWLYNGEVNVQDATAKLCSAEGRSNYRALLGLSGGTASINVGNGGKVINSSAQLVTNYGDNTTVNITVNGEGSSFTQSEMTATTGCEHVGHSGEWVYRVKGEDGWFRNTGWYDKDSTGDSYVSDKYDSTITYLCDSGTDQRGKKYAASGNCTTNISAVNGGVVDIQSKLTYIGSILDKDSGIADKSANFTIGAGSSVSFKRMEIYAETHIVNGGTFSATNVTLNDGAALTYTSTDAGASFDVDSLTVESGAELALVFGDEVESVSAYSLLREALATADTNTISLDTNLTLESGSVLTINGGVIDLNGKALTISDGAIINTLGMAEGNNMNTLFTNVGTFTMNEGATVVVNGVSSRVSYDGSSVVVATVPEPTTTTLSLLALAGLVMRRRRQ